MGAWELGHMNHISSTTLTPLGLDTGSGRGHGDLGAWGQGRGQVHGDIWGHGG